MNHFRLFRTLAAATLFATSLAAEAAPDEATIEKLIAAMRETAMAYDSRLPDFICTQITHREIRGEPTPAPSVRSSGGGGLRGLSSMPTGGSTSPGWRPVDSIEQQLTYFGHRETYIVVALNGKKAEPGATPETGLTSTGEFGSTLASIFDPLSRAEFKWRRWDKLRGQPVSVFSYSIAKENSSSELSAGSAHVVVGYHGLVFAERETGIVVRLTTVAEAPKDFPLQNVTRELEYGRATISGEVYLLPLHSEMESTAREDFLQSGRANDTSPIVTLRNKIDFKAFRKYGVDSVLKPE